MFIETSHLYFSCQSHEQDRAGQCEAYQQEGQQLCPDGEPRRLPEGSQGSLAAFRLSQIRRSTTDVFLDDV